MSKNYTTITFIYEIRTGRYFLMDGVLYQKITLVNIEDAESDKKKLDDRMTTRNALEVETGELFGFMEGDEVISVSLKKQIILGD